MTGPESRADVARWITYAREDLETAELLLANASVPPRHVCCFAQLAAEKSIKAALVASAVNFPVRQELDALRNLLPSDWRLRHTHSDLAELTEWGVEARYPGEWPDPTREDATRAVEQAETIYLSIIKDLEGRRRRE